LAILKMKEIMTIVHQAFLAGIMVGGVLASVVWMWITFRSKGGEEE